MDFFIFNAALPKHHTRCHKILSGSKRIPRRRRCLENMGKHHKEHKDVPPPTDEDVCFGKADHPGTVQFMHVCQGTALQYPDDHYGPEIYAAMKRPLEGRRFFVHSKKRDRWVLAGKKTKTRHFEKEFNRLNHKHLVVVEESDPDTETEAHDSGYNLNEQHPEEMVDIEMGNGDTKKIHSGKTKEENGTNGSSVSDGDLERLQLPKGVADPLEPREGRDLVWKNVCMTLNSKKKEDSKKLLDNVWGEVPQGQVTAVMGPSGSGKTSLLNILAGRASSKNNLEITADVRLNNVSVDPTNIEVRKKIAFVAQDDSLQITSTPREAIKFSARLRLPKTLTDEELNSLTERMLKELGLTKCADTLVGGALLKGISGGERKRTSVGVELVVRPAMVFLDEPTSGLDSFNAVQLCQLLGSVAKAGSSVLFTIHQPSSDIFNAFDSLILLNSGRVMYQGSVKEVPSYFARCGCPVPHHYNPADWIMTVALTNTIEELEEKGFFPKDTREIGDAFKRDSKMQKDVLGITDRSSGSEKSPPGLFTQTKLLSQREVKNLRRATHAIKARTAMTLMISLVIGCIFYQVASENFTTFIKTQSTFGALLMSVMANVFSTTLPSLTAFPEERPVFLREYSTNHYSVLAYFLSRLSMELFINACQVSVSAILTYFLVGYTANFGIFWAGLYLMACASTALGVLVGSSVENPSVAVEFLPAVFLPQILFSGFFVPPGLMPVWLGWLRWVFPLTYGVKIVVAAEFGHGRCDATSPPDPNYCEQIMGNVQTQVGDLWWYFLVLLCLFVFFRLLALFILRSKAQKFY